MKSGLIALIICFGIIANAKNAVVISVDDNNSQALVSSSKLSDVEDGDILVSGNCEIEVERRLSRKNLILNILDCDKIIKKGAQISLSKTEDDLDESRVEDFWYPQFSRTQKVQKSTSKRGKVSPSQGSSTLSLNEVSPDSFNWREKFRVSIIKSLIDGDVSVKSGDQSGKGPYEIEQVLGLSASYADIKLLEPGYIADISFHQLDDENGALIRFSANGAMKVYKELYIFAGPHFQDVFSDPKNIAGFGFGYQGGLGYQVTEKIGLSANYIYSKHSLKSELVDPSLNEAKISLKGIEMALFANF